MIYFLKAVQFSENIKAGWIKIGTTICLSERLKQIMYEIGHEPTLLGVIGGGHAEERAIHGRFAAFRRDGEWFDPDGSDLIEMIGTEARPWDGVDESPRLYTAAIRLDAEVLVKARKAAMLLDVSLADYASDILEKAADADLEREGKKLAKGNKPTKGPT